MGIAAGRRFGVGAPASVVGMSGAQTKEAPPCLSCRGRGWKLRSSRADLFVPMTKSADVGELVAECTGCAGSGLADAV